jgi:hypothetical protein
MKILAVCGRKQSGKNTSLNWLMGCSLYLLEEIDWAYIHPELGKLIIPAHNEQGFGEFDAERAKNDPKMISYLKENIWPTIKNYSFADPLKQMAINILGLEPRQCYGTDEDKNSLTHLKWQDMPGVVTKRKPKGKDIKPVSGRLGKYYDCLQKDSTIYHKPGHMTAREVLQYMGTEVFRKMYGNVWVDACIRKIQKEQPKLAVITDCRFPNEVEGVQQAGGKVLRYTRAPYPEDMHDSESSLDRDKFDWDRFDAVIDNAEMSVPEQNQAFHKQLMDWGWMTMEDSVPLEESPKFEVEQRPTRRAVTVAAKK